MINVALLIAPSARMEIHISSPMQSSAEVAELPTSRIAMPANPESSRVPKELITLRYVDSGGGALPGAHWELVDRTAPRFDPLKGLRGRRPQKGCMPKVLTLTNSTVSDTRADSVEGLESTVNNGESENQLSGGDTNDERSTTVTDNSRDAPNSHSKTLKSTLAAMKDVNTSTSAVKAADAQSNTPNQTSGNLEPSNPSRYATRGKAPRRKSTSTVSSATSPISHTKRRLQRIQDTVPFTVHTRTSDAHTRADLSRIFSPSHGKDDTMLKSQDIEVANTTDGESNADSEAASETASLSDSSTQEPRSSSSSVAPPIGRRAERLAKAAARRATLARFGNDGPVSVSAEASRIARYREDPDFNKDKAVATAISNRGRGLRPRKWPPVPVVEDDDDNDTEKEGDEDEEEQEEERSDYGGRGHHEKDDTEGDEGNDDNDDDYDNDNDDSSHMAPSHRPLRPGSTRKRRANDDYTADFVPGKKFRKPKLAITNTRRDSASMQGALGLQHPRVKDSVTEGASSSASPPASAGKAVQQKARPGRKSTSQLPRPYSCDTCGQRFNRQEHVKRHMVSVHSSEKAFACTTCGKRFARRDNLTQHIGSHFKTQYEASSEDANQMQGATAYDAFASRNSNGLISGIQMDRIAASETASTQQQLRIAENHRRLADQGKL